MRQPRTLTVNLPDHKTSNGNRCSNSKPIKVTGRKSKQQERPRNHRCKDCGQGFWVDAGHSPVLIGQQ